MCHVADRYPLFSKTTFRWQSSFTFRINSPGAPIHPDSRCSHVVLVIVQAWFRGVQVVRASPISIETPPQCSTVRIESDVTRTNPRPRVTVSNFSTLPGHTTTSVSGSGYFSVAFACVMIFYVCQRIFLSVCSFSNRPLSARLSWAFLYPHSPLALTVSVAPLPMLLSRHSLLASLRLCRAFHVALVV